MRRPPWTRGPASREAEPSPREAEPEPGEAVPGSREVPTQAPRSPAALLTAETPLGRAARVSLQILLIAAATAVVAFVLLNLRLVVLPVLAALFLATILKPPADWLKRRGFPGGVAAGLMLALAVAIVVLLARFLAPRVVDEFGGLGNRLEKGFAEVGTFVASLGISQEQIDRAIEAGLGTFRSVGGSIGEGLLTGALLVVELLAALLITLVVLFFLLKDGDRIWSWFVGLLPGRRRGDARELGHRSWSTLGHYVRGVAFVALVDALLIGTGLAIIGVPLVLPLAVLIFFASFFPLIGAITAGFVAALVALVSNGPVAALVVVAIITAVQQLEGNLLYPVVMGRQVELHPVAILLAVTAGGVIAGVLGALFAVPIAAVAWTMISYFRDEPDAAEPVVAPSPVSGEP